MDRRGLTLAESDYLKAFDRMLAGEDQRGMLAVRLEDMADDALFDPPPDRAACQTRDEFLDRMTRVVAGWRRTRI